MFEELPAMKRTYLFFALAVSAFAFSFHVRYPYSEEWALYQLFLTRDLSDPAHWPELYGYLANHRILTIRLIYLFDYYLSLRGSLVLLTSVIVGFLGFYVLDQKLLPRQRTWLERACLMGIYFSFLQFESFIHPHVINYNIHNATLISFIYFLAAWPMPLMLMISGFNLLGWVALIPVWIFEWYRLRFRKIPVFTLTLLCTLFLAWFYLDAPKQDPFHGQIYYNFNVIKYFILSYSLPFHGLTPALKPYAGILLLVLHLLVFWKLEKRARWIMFTVAASLGLIAIGRACPANYCLSNATNPRYYTFLVPSLFVLLDYLLIRTKGRMRFALLGICLVWIIGQNFLGLKEAQAFVRNRQRSMDCVKHYYYTNEIPADCNINYIFYQFSTELSHKRRREILEETSEIMRGLGYWEVVK
jgi:hypothetical protein